MSDADRTTDDLASPERRPIAIVGAGPVGLALALGLARHDVPCVVLEREEGPSRQSKALNLHLRTREVLRQWEVEQHFLEAGLRLSALSMRDAATGRERFTFDLRDLDDVADPAMVLLEQSETERLLRDAATQLGTCEVRYASEVVGLDHDADGVRLTVHAGGRDDHLDVAFAVGCDGASSFVRDALGLPFEGHTYPVRAMVADVHLDDDRDGLPWPRMHDGRRTISVALRLRPGTWRIIGITVDARDTEGAEARGSNGAAGSAGDTHGSAGDTHGSAGDTHGRNGNGRGHDGDVAEIADHEVRRRAARCLGDGPMEVIWASGFRLQRRASPRFRVGRVLLAWDAAHIHSPLGGQGMNAGIQDAHNLAWKLAAAWREGDAAWRGGDADRLLDSYAIERRQVVVEGVSRNTDRATRWFLQAPATARAAMMVFQRHAMRIAPLRRRALRMLSMIDLGYTTSPLLDDAHRSAGRRLPDPLLVSPDGGEVRLHTLLPSAAPALIAVHSDHSTDRSGRPAASDVEVVRIGPGGHHDPRGVFERLLGARDGHLLIRPDGHIAFALPGHGRGDLDTSIARALGRRGRVPL